MSTANLLVPTNTDAGINTATLQFPDQTRPGATLSAHPSGTATMLAPTRAAPLRCSPSVEPTCETQTDRIDSPRSPPEPIPQYGPPSPRQRSHSLESRQSYRAPTGHALHDSSTPLSLASLPPRNIVISLDGTGNEFGERNSNVIKTMSCLAGDDSQLLYYSSGVGTVLPDQAGTWGRLRSKAAKITDMMMAWNHVEFLCNAYKYLMDFYRAGDKVYILGFSRGAYTARCLAGMIQQVGLLPPGNYSQVKLAYQIYMRGAKTHLPGWLQAIVDKRKKATDAPQEPDASAKKANEPATMYRQIFGISRAVRIEFVGVWDTVSSLGGVFLPRLPAAGNVKSVKFFRQALALDERRARFAPEYRYLTKDELPTDLSSVKSKLSHARALWRKLAPGADVTPQEREEARVKLNAMLSEKSATIAMTDPIPVVRAGELGMRMRILVKNKEVWFMGCHSDVGGGNDLNKQDSLSNIPFRWMLREAVQCGIKLDAKGVCLQPAIYNTAFVQERHLIPAELIDLVQREVGDEVFEAEHEDRIQALIDQHLPPARMLEVVELAAASDTGLRTTDSGEEDGRLAETTDMPPGYHNSETDSALERTARQPGEEPPTGPDGLKLPQESLTVWWYPLEVTVLQTRRYGGWTGKDKDVWRMNLGRPRQIVHGQMIHRSVLKRFQHHKPTVPHTDAEPGAMDIGPRTIIGPLAPTRQSGASPEDATGPIIEICVSSAADDSASARVPDTDRNESSSASGASVSEQQLKNDAKPPKGKGVYWAPKAVLPVEWRTSWDGLRDESGGPTVVWEF